jgi:deoxyribonuclease-4
VDLRTREGVDAVLRELDEGCGPDRLAMFHLNDSKTPLGSNRDRHENIGDGDLGEDAFRLLVNEPAFADLPGILEVPGFDGQGPDKENLARLRALVG